MNEKLLTIAQTAEYLQCSQSTIRSRIKRGTLKAVKNGRIVRIPESELDKFFHADEPTETADRPQWDGISGKEED